MLGYKWGNYNEESLSILFAVGIACKNTKDQGTSKFFMNKMLMLSALFKANL
ncbi:hypothetical protein PMIT1303_02496 [Prochlorococcus sp. MIT 1303]|nr:hypothetical protein PMIT1303_02496 [Prochlorococcus sp. MIT 1303]